MFLGFGKFAVANDMAEEVAAAFLQRPHLVAGCREFRDLVQVAGGRNQVCVEDEK